MVITTSVETLYGSWIYCYIGYILGTAPQSKEIWRHHLYGEQFEVFSDPKSLKYIFTQ